MQIASDSSKKKSHTSRRRCAVVWAIPAIPRKEGMLGHDFNNADGQAINDETNPDTGRYLHESDTTELKQRRMAAQEIWECMDCGAKGELDPRGGGCAACGSQALSPLRESLDPVAEKEKHQTFRETSPEKYQENLDTIRERQRHEIPAPMVVKEKPVTPVLPRQRALAAEYAKSTCEHCGESIYQGLKGMGPWYHDKTQSERCHPGVLRTQKPTYATPKTAQGSGGTTVTFQNQNVTNPSSPNKSEPMAVPEAIDQQAGPHSPNAPMTAPRTPGITPKIVNVPPGTEGEGASNMASAKTGNEFEDMFGDLLSQYACPHCQSVNVDVTPTEDGYDIYCEDCERVTPSHGGATPSVSGFPATETEFVDPDLEMEPEEPPFEVTSSFVRTAAINVSQGQDAQGFHMNIDMNGRGYVLRGDNAEQFRREYAAIPKPEGKVNALVEKYMNVLKPYTKPTIQHPTPVAEQAEGLADADAYWAGKEKQPGDEKRYMRQAPAPKQKSKSLLDWGIPAWLRQKEQEEAVKASSKQADALFEEQPLIEVTDLDALFAMPQERKEEWLVAHGWTKDESWHGASWWMQQPMWSKDGREEDIPYQETDNAIEKQVEILGEEDDEIESKGIGCRECGAILNNAEGDLCPQCQAEGAEDREDPFDKEGAGSNSGEDDPRGVGTNYNDEFYEHRTTGLVF